MNPDDEIADDLYLAEMCVKYCQPPEQEYKAKYSDTNDFCEFMADVWDCRK